MTAPATPRPPSQLTSPIDGKPIGTVDQLGEEWYHAFRMWYAEMIIDRAENPSTLSEINNCALCHGAEVYHHCLFDQCTGPNSTRTEECLHPREREWAAYQELRSRYQLKIKEARFVQMHRAILENDLGSLFGSNLTKPPLPIKFPRIISTE